MSRATHDRAGGTQGRLGLAGDWHGDTFWATKAVRLLADIGVTAIHHLGDFGVWPGPAGAAYLDAVDSACAEVGLPLYITPGNHEDHPRIAATPLVDRDDGMGAVGWLTTHIAVLPRGHRWRWADRRCVSLGGAPSVDVSFRIPDRNWWAAEAITEADVARVVAGGRAEVFFAHDAPAHSTPRVDWIIDNNPAGWPESALAYAARGRAAITEAFATVLPDLYVHGHFHVTGDATRPKSLNAPGASGECRFVALSEERTPGNLAILDPVDLSIHPVLAEA